MKNFLKKADVRLIILLILVGVFFVLMLFLNRKPGANVVVKIDDEIVDIFSLYEERTQVYEGESGSNTLVISGKSAYVMDANCPDKLCERMGPVSKSGETIVCLPHHFVVTIEGEDEGVVDAISR